MHHGVGVGEGKVEFVGGEDDGFAVGVGQSGEKCGNLFPTGDVEKRGRFVEQNRRGVLSQSSGEHDALGFAVAERGYGA